jgi:hypothetical protein
MEIVLTNKNQKSPSSLLLEGLHPVFFTLSVYQPVLSPRSAAVVLEKAGLLASPPVRRPSHWVKTQQWLTELNRFPYFKKGRGYSGGTAPDFNGIPY